MSIARLDLHGSTYRALGEAHGARLASDIARLADIRLALLERRSRIAGRQRLLALAAAHLAPLRIHLPALADELEGIAAASGVGLARLVVLNHYTDLRDIGPQAAGLAGGCSVVYAPRPGGAVVGQTWDMHASAEPFVRVLRIRPPDAPACLVFTVAGCVGMMGLNAARVCVCINNLTPTDARVGVLWPAVVRAMLAQTTARAALDVLMRTPLGSGHNYLVADPRHAFEVETTGQRKVVLRRDPDRVVWHTNHYLSEALLPLQAPLYPTSTTHERYARLAALLAAHPIRTPQDLMAVLASHEGHPRSVCSHLLDERDPSAAKTCGAVVCDLREGTFHAAAGCLQASGFEAIAMP